MPTPQRITITGPRHHVEKIDAATTDPIDATGTRGSAVFTTNVYVADPLVQVVQTTSIRVTVLVQKVRQRHHTLSCRSYGVIPSGAVSQAKRRISRGTEIQPV